MTRPDPAAAAARLRWGGELFELCPEKAAHLPEHGTLLVADVHIGKALSFRRLGVPVPGGTTDETLARLSSVIERCRVRSLVLLGDFFHSADAQAAPTQARLARWRDRHADVTITLVRGNHDDQAGDPAASLGIEVVDEPWPLGTLALAHRPPRAEPSIAMLPVVAGHVHPCVHVGRGGIDRLRLPCFHFADRVALMPAFGAFTGMHRVAIRPGQRAFAVADGQVLAVSAPAAC